jgi:PhnB protein
MTIYTHLNFGGNCEEAFRFYEKQLGGKITIIMHQSELPSGYDKAPETGQAVVHARLSVAGIELIGNDVPAAHFQPIRSSYLFLTAESTEDAERLWKALVEGGESTMSLAETFFATRFGQLRDRFGVLWSIIHPRPMP